MSQKRKKSRKVGLIGVRKDPDFKKNRSSHSRSDTSPPKKTKGKPAGSRHNVEMTKASGEKRGKASSDPRHGSKKPISLVATAAVTKKVEQKKYATPAEELAAIEADARLVALLDKLDSEQKLTKEQEQYVETMMARHKVLCDLMGISDEEDDDDDPFDSLDAMKIDDFR